MTNQGEAVGMMIPGGAESKDPMWIHQYRSYQYISLNHPGRSFTHIKKRMAY